jgi:hypothetical protein
LLAHGRWFSPASSTTKTGRHDIAEILLKVALNTINEKINQSMYADTFQMIMEVQDFKSHMHHVLSINDQKCPNLNPLLDIILTFNMLLLMLF